MSLFEIKEKLEQFGLEWFNRYYGLYTGFVSSSEDPENLGRLQLLVPNVYGTKPYKYWAMPRGMMSGKGIGFFFIPNKGDKVWVSFENGDPKFPVWEYGNWAKGDVPAGATPLVKILKTTTGHTIEFNDTEGKERILITDKSKNIITLDREGCSIESPNISFGTYKTSKEKGTLGDTTQKKLEEICAQISALCDALLALTVATALGPSSPPINAAQFTAVKTKIEALKATLPEILSKKVTLD